MSRFNNYKNEFDQEDDGEEIDITPADIEASDEQGREEAATLIRTGESITGTGKYDEQQRRMWFRWAQKTLADGATRREEAAAAARAERQAERDAEERAEREQRQREERESKEQRRRERFEGSMRESDERWARIDEQTRRENAAWEAGREERERAQREEATRPSREPSRGARQPQPSTAWNTSTTARAEDRMIRPPESSSRSSQAHRVVTTVMPTVPLSTSPASSAASPSPKGPVPGSLRPPSQIPSWQSAPSRPAQPGTESRRTTATTVRPPPRPVPTTAVPAGRAVVIAPPPATLVAASPIASATERVPVTLTGADLVRWRTARGVTQRVAAEVLGVAPSTVAKAELLPTKALGEALAIALRGLLAS